MYPKPKQTKEPFPVNNYWRCAYDCKGSNETDIGKKFHLAINQEALAPGRRILVSKSTQFPPYLGFCAGVDAMQLVEANRSMIGIATL